MKDQWFRWEREAAIHLLFPTLEGSMQPLKKFSGYSFPTTILIFKNGIATWCLKEKEFYELAGKLLAIYKDESKEREMAEELTKRSSSLIKIEKEIDSVKTQRLADNALTDLYSKLHNAFINYYGIGAIQEPVAIQAESELRKNKSLTDEQISGLISPAELSYVKEADNYLLKSKHIKGFIKKYYWIDNNYSETKVLSKDDVEKRLIQIKPNKAIHPFDSSDLILSNDEKRLIEMLKNFAIYQDDRKKNILIYLHFLEILLKETGKRVKLDLQTMRNTFPEEMRGILNGKISKEFIKTRKEKCFVVWEKGKGKPQILIGEDAKGWEEKLSPKINSRVTMVKGKCASKGKISGKVRILLNANENDELKQGEVLVTFMTSPDFMSSIRKSCAIVTNFGGVTSHAAIISRELGIPCVVGTKNATEILKTGDMVEVDADKGIIRVLK